MQPYLVHVEREAITAWETVGIQPTDGRSITYRLYNQNHQVKIDANIRDDNLVAMETWYCRNEAEATMLATSLATKAPGRTILITKVLSIAQSVANPPTISTVSEKGVLPR